MINEKKQIHIKNFANVIPPEDIQKLKDDLRQHNITVPVSDSAGNYMLSFDDVHTVVSIAIQSTVLISLVESIGQSAVWDAIKFFSRKSWERISGQKYKKVHLNGDIENKNMTFGIQAKIDHASYTFRFDEISPDNAEVALDKILDFLREQKNHEFASANIGQYNNEKQEWEFKELLELAIESEQEQKEQASNKQKA
ncbi:hypothetical protein ACQKFW_07465 [Bacillus subtilis]